MATDLTELVPSLKREVSAPGEEESTFPDATTASWEGYLSDAFWGARLDGMLEGYELSANMVTPDLSRDLQQLVVLYAGITIVRNQLRGLNTTFRASAGPVEYEVQQAATLLKALLDDMINRRDIVLRRLSDLGTVEDYYIDALSEREYGLRVDNYYWPR